MVCTSAISIKDIPHGLKHLLHLRARGVCVDCKSEGHTTWNNVFTVTEDVWRVLQTSVHMD